MNSNNNEYANANDPKLYKKNINDNLKGFDTSFSNMHLSMMENNRPLYNDENFKNHNIIPSQLSYPNNPPPNRDLSPKFIPRQYKIIIHSANKLTGGTNGNYSVRLSEPIKNVVSARLLNCTLYDVGDNYTGADSASFTKAGDYISLHIDGFEKNIGTSIGSAGLGDRINGSFAVLYYKGLNNTAVENVVNYHNSFHDNYDIKYFDPPLSRLDTLKVNLYDNSGNDTGTAIANTFELLVETLEKVRVYS